MSEDLPIRIRAATDADVAYVLNSWLETYRRESLWSKHMENDVFYPNHRPIAVECVEQDDTIVAADANDPTHLIGFACGRRHRGGLAMHFVYVKFAFRGFGVGRALLTAFEWKDKEPIVATHWTRAIDGLSMKIPIAYNPYLLFTTKEIPRHA
jgi:GNAT superfamily N-acetyltransferase